MNTEQFDKYIQSSLTDHEVKPPTDLWEGIEAGLPTRPLTYKRWVIGSALLTLLLLLGSFAFFNNYQIEINQKNLGQTTTNVLEEQQQPISFIHTNLPKKDYFGNFINIFELNRQRLFMRLSSLNLQPNHATQKNIANKKETIDEFDKALNHLMVFNDEPAPQKDANNLLFQNTETLNLFDFKQFNNRLDYILLEPTSLFNTREQDFVAEIASIQNDEMLSSIELASSELIDVVPSDDLSSSKGWYSGPTYQSQWSWLVNQNTNASGSANNLTQMALPGNAFGVMVGYDFNKSAGIQMEWILNSEQGFDFVNFDARGETRYEYQQNLNYMLFPVLFKYRKQYENQLFGKTLALNHLVGLQYGYLRDAHSYVNGEYVKADWQNRSNLGLVVGMGYDVYLTNQASFSIGARSTFGKSLYNLEGIFNDDQLYNLHFGVNASLRYNFNK